MKSTITYLGLIVLAIFLSSFLLKESFTKEVYKPNISVDYKSLKKEVTTSPINTAKYTKKSAKAYRYAYKSGSKMKSKYNKNSRDFFTIESKHYLLPTVSTNMQNKTQVSMPKNWNDYYNLPATDQVYSVYQRKDIDELFTAVVDTLVKIDNQVLNYIQESNKDIQNGFTEALKTQIELYLEKREKEWIESFRTELKEELKKEILSEINP